MMPTFPTRSTSNPLWASVAHWSLPGLQVSTADTASSVHHQNHSTKRGNTLDRNISNLTPGWNNFLKPWDTLLAAQLAESSQCVCTSLIKELQLLGMLVLQSGILFPISITWKAESPNHAQMIWTWKEVQSVPTPLRRHQASHAWMVFVHSEGQCQEEAPASAGGVRLGIAWPPGSRTPMWHQSGPAWP